MNQESKWALSYGEPEPISKAKFRLLLDYSVAALAVGLALLIQCLQVPVFGVSQYASPFIVFFAAVMVAAWFGGLGPGLLATGLSALFSWYFLHAPPNSFDLGTFGQCLHLAAFVLEGVLISALVGMLHAAWRRAEANALKVERDAALGDYQIAGEVFVARDGDSEAVDYLHRRGAHESRSAKNPKVVLIDLKLPKEDGPEVLGRTKSDPKLKMIPVVMLTPSREERDLLRSYNLGTNAYVVKPMSFTDFIKAVKEVGLFWGVINHSPGIVEWKT